MIVVKSFTFGHFSGRGAIAKDEDSVKIVSRTGFTYSPILGNETTPPNVVKSTKNPFLRRLFHLSEGPKPSCINILLEVALISASWSIIEYN